MSRFACSLVIASVLLGTSAARAELPNAYFGRLPATLPGVTLSFEPAPRAHTPRRTILAGNAIRPEPQLSESEKDARRAVGQFRDLWSQLQLHLGRNKLQVKFKAAF